MPTRRPQEELPDGGLHLSHGVPVVPEEERDASYKETKDLLAKLISTHCPGISYQYALSQIKRAHRERKRNSEEVHLPSREGKRLIYAALHDWDLCQLIIETLKQKCIAERDFNISADQKYGPLTTKRRQMAFLLRKQLKANGVIVSGYIDFPAKLMVNMPGDFTGDGKKLYKLYKNFSREPVEFLSENNSQFR